MTSVSAEEEYKYEEVKTLKKNLSQIISSFVLLIKLLNRVYGIMREKNPGLDSGDKKKFVLRPPQVARAGSKKTAFSNFADICKL